MNLTLNVRHQAATDIKMRSLHRQERSRIVEFARLPLWPLIQARSVHDNLAVGSKLHEGPIHRPRRRPFKVDALIVVAASVARTLEFVLASFRSEEHTSELQ